MRIPISEITVNPGRRELDLDDVKELADSIRELGLLHPIIVDKKYTLIAGLHRLEAVKLLEWTEIECTVSSLEGLKAELAEIDENVVRSDLSALEFGELLLKRKDIYEALHPEARATYNGGGFRGNQHKRQIRPWWAKNLRPPQNRLSRIPLKSWAPHRAQLKSRSKLQEISPQR